jgi:hypothetical protein
MLAEPVAKSMKITNFVGVRMTCHLVFAGKIDPSEPLDV